MKLCTIVATAFIATVSLPLSATAQGVPGGISHGVQEGNRHAGPVGAVVGGVVGGVIGGVEGVLGVDRNYQTYTERPARTYRHRRAVRKNAKRTRYSNRYR